MDYLVSGQKKRRRCLQGAAWANFPNLIEGSTSVVDLITSRGGFKNYKQRFEELKIGDVRM